MISAIHPPGSQPGRVQVAAPTARFKKPVAITSIEEFYARALAVEHEAAARYAELGRHMAERGDAEVSSLFLRLALFERQHVQRLSAKCAGLELPPVANGDYAWIEQGTPLPEAHEFVLRMMTPRFALQLALIAERRAKAYFDSALDTVEDPELCALVRECSAEESEHIAWVQKLLDQHPRAPTPEDLD